MTNKLATIADIGEFETLRRIWRILEDPREPARAGSGRDILVGLGDDAAIVKAPQRPVVLTTDAMVEGVHFQHAWCGADDLAHKILASNLSDLASKCAEPRFALITLGLPGKTLCSWVEAFYHKLAELSKMWNVAVVGGDLVKSEAVFVSLTAWGEMQTPTPIRIDGARPGDGIYVTGSLGDAAAGLEILQNEREWKGAERKWLVQRMLRPTPRIRESQALAKYALPSAMTDISDGLARDLRKLCAASHVGATLDSSRLPCSESLLAYSPLRAADYAWRGGEDFELLFTLDPKHEERLMAKWETGAAPIECIGRIVEENQIRWSDGRTVEDGGYDHFLPVAGKLRHGSR